MTRLADHAVSRIRPARQTQRALKITVLSGGPSDEREVSLKSGRAVAEALRIMGHEVHLADIDPDSLDALEVPADLVFIALHGAFGEDGRLQQVLENRGVRYCGSGAWASSLAMDKVASKCRFVEEEIPTPRFDVVAPDRLERVLQAWGCPAVVKPIAQGSSIDCRLVRDSGDLPAVLSDVLQRYGRCLIEEYIEGPELTVGILGEKALPPIQIRTRRSFYDYQAKYEDDDTEYLFDIELPRAVLDEIETLSLRAHKALGCRDFSRVDWMVDAATHQPYVLEVNTIPGFTDHSLLPKAALRAGLTLPQLCQRIVELACQR
jgi:D-alanine-D-alanine ligase